MATPRKSQTWINSILQEQKGWFLSHLTIESKARLEKPLWDAFKALNTRGQWIRKMAQNRSLCDKGGHANSEQCSPLLIVHLTIYPSKRQHSPCASKINHLPPMQRHRGDMSVSENGVLKWRLIDLRLLPCCKCPVSLKCTRFTPVFLSCRPAKRQMEGR